jgi:hypothetical protein
MLIAPLQQALCADRSKVSAGPDPSDWILPSLPDGWRILSFHFFVDWSQAKPLVADSIWMTRLVRLNNDESISNIVDKDLLDRFCEGHSRSYFQDLELVCASYKIRVSSILLPEISGSEITGRTPVWVVARSDRKEMRIWRTSVDRLKSAIQERSGGPVKVGAKGLIYGTSAIECQLSRTDAAFPGDADAVIVDDQNLVRCVIEYKKHTLSSPLSDHLIEKYYPFPDGRKYRRLNALVEHCQYVGQREVPLIVLYYSTKSPVIRLQEIVLLEPNRVAIRRDSYDLHIDGQRNKEISDKINNWLGMNR